MGDVEVGGRQFWDVFISYATEDKNEVSEPLANALDGRGISVWYNDFELQARDSLIERTDYNTYRPHSALGMLTSAEYADQWAKTTRKTLITP